MDNWEELAKRDVDGKRYDDAILALGKQIEKSGKSPAALYLRSLAYFGKGECQKALFDANEALLTDSPQKPALIIHKATLLWEISSPAAAIRWLEDNRKTLSDDKTEQSLKAKYKEECGLEFGTPTMAMIERFLAWLKENGAQFDKIRMKYYGPDYRGVHATKPIESSEVFLWVPKKLIITSQMGKQTAIGAKIVDSGLQLGWEYLIYITVFLLVQQHDEDSWWKPYMDVYPKSVDTFPMFFPAEEKALLKGSPMTDQIESDLAELKEEYDKIVGAVPEFKQFSFEEYARNKVLVNSRIFYVNMNESIERIMVPLADMFNHHYEKIGQTYWKYVDAEEAFLVKAQSEIPLGDAICENYGEKPNYRFLFFYGFLIDDNRHNAVYIKLHLNPGDPYRKIKERMLGLKDSSYIKSFRYGENFSESAKWNRKLLGYLRFVEYEGDLNKLCKYLDPAVKDVKSCTAEPRKLRLPVVSIENEKKVLAKLKYIAEKCLSKYPQTYEDDLGLLKGELSFNKRNCIVFRAGEKKIYKYMISMADIGLALLNKKAKSAGIDVSTLVQNTPFGPYIQKCIVPLTGKWKQPSPQ